MENPLKNLSLSTLLVLGTLVTSASAQGRVICFSIEGTANATGKDSMGAPSKTGVGIGGKNTFVSPGAGQTPTQVRDALHDALKAKGYGVGKVGASVVCVSSLPGGAPVTGGGGIGDTDSGLSGIDVEIFQPPPVKAEKPAGGAVPGAKPGVPAPRPLQITITIEIEVNGQKQKITVTVTINQGETSQTINPKIKSALQAQGLLVNDVTWESLLDGPTAPPIQGFGLDRTASGYPVTHIALEAPQVPIELLSMELTGGTIPATGFANFGLGCSRSLLRPYLRPGTNPPRVNSFFDVFAELMPPSSPCALAIGPTPSAFRFDMLCTGSTILVDPTTAVLFSMSSSPSGQLHLPVTLGYNPTWVGLKLYWQGIGLESMSQLALTDGLVSAIGR